MLAHDFADLDVLGQSGSPEPQGLIKCLPLLEAGDLIASPIIPGDPIDRAGNDRVELAVHGHGVAACVVHQQDITPLWSQWVTFEFGLLFVLLRFLSSFAH